MTRTLVGLGALVVGTIVLAEVLLDPAAGDRWRLWAIIVVPAAVAAVATPVLGRWVSRRASVAGVALAVGLCSLLLGTVSSSAASNAMFVSGHDFRLFLVVLVVSSGIALVVGSQLTRPLARDVQRLGHVAAAVAAGDLTVRTGIERADEVGTTATALDRMVATLDAADTDRRRLAADRQQLFASLGHDLRTPLAAMRAAVESLQDGVATDPARTLATVHGHVRAMEAMLEQLIELSRLGGGHVITPVERLSLTELADECIEALSPLATASGVRLALVADDAAMLTGSAFELSRLVRNLVDNAVRHSPSGATVTIEVTAAPAVHTVSLQVRDEGDGFPEWFRDQAFEPFTRADESRTSSARGNAGLGLAICRAVVDAHGGTIEVGTGPGGIVTVTLPTAPAPPVVPPSDRPLRSGEPS
jgi:two-component system sensor histidine kinase BaeS